MKIASLATKFISKMGDNSGSRVPLLVKDTTCNFLISSIYAKKGGEDDGKERLIEEFGTEAVWIGGIPFIRWLIDKTAYKFAGINPEFDVRKFSKKNADNLAFMKECVKNSPEQLKQLDKLAKNKKLALGLYIGKFIASTAISLFALRKITDLKQKTTQKKLEEQILNSKQSKELISSNIQADVQKYDNFTDFKKNQTYHNSQKQKQAQSNSANASKPAFKGIASIMQNFVFNPVMNNSILDFGLSAQRMEQARKGEHAEVFLKEALTIAFYYPLATPIQKGMEGAFDKLFKKPVNLDYRIISDKNFKENIKNGKLAESIKKFNALDDTQLTKTLFNSQDDAVVDLLKKTGVLKTYKKTNELSALQKFDFKEIRGTLSDIGDFVKKAGNAPEGLDKFISSAKKCKCGSIFASLAITIGVIGILQPLSVFMLRKIRGGSNENPAIVEIKNKLHKEQQEKLAKN